MKNTVFLIIMFLILGCKKRIEQPIVSFGMVADCQYDRIATSSTRFYKDSYQKLKEAISFFNQNDLSFVISLGDFVDRDFDSLVELSFLCNDSKHPFYHILGNHDYLSSVNTDLQKEIFKLMNLKSRYYSLVVNHNRFIMLDGNEISTYANSPESSKYKEALSLLKTLKEEGRSNAYSWNSAISSEQLVWMENKLKESQNKSENIFIFIHQPLLPEKSIENLWNNKEMISILEKYKNVKAVFSGHNHKGGYAFKKGIHYYTAKGLIESKKNACEIVKVYQKYFSIQTFGDVKGVKKYFF